MRTKDAKHQTAAVRRPQRLWPRADAAKRSEIRTAIYLMPDPGRCFCMQVMPRVSSHLYCVAFLRNGVIDIRDSSTVAGNLLTADMFRLRHHTCCLFGVSGRSGSCTTPTLAPPVARPPFSVFSRTGTPVRVTPALVVARNPSQNAGAESSTRCCVVLDLDLMQRDGRGSSVRSGPVERRAVQTHCNTVGMGPRRSKPPKRPFLSFVEKLIIHVRLLNSIELQP